jgi:RND family efflux transporter MFP subunit
MKNIFKSVALFSLLTTFLFSCSGDKTKDAKILPAVAATVKQVAGANSSKYVSASGKIEAENSANVSTRMMGYITSIKVKTGQKVSKGQLLATVNNTDLQAKRAQTEAGITQATAAYNSAKKDYDRFVVLLGQKSASQKEMDNVATQYEMAKAGLEAAKQMKNEVMAQFSYTNITAPFSGTITNTFVKEGDMANPGMPLVSLEGNTKLQAIVMVSESEISQIKNGMAADIMVKSIDKSFKGNVIEVSSSAKNTGGQYIVKLSLENTNESILSGMFANVVFPVEKPNVTAKNTMILVPKKAIINQGQLNGIYTVNNDRIAILRWLRLGKTFGDQVEVLSGLSAGENYIVEAQSKLYNGAKIAQ